MWKFIKSKFIKSKFAESKFVESEFAESNEWEIAACERRRLDKISWDVIWTIICLKISFLISRVMTSLLNTEWASTMMKTWLCFEFLISNTQESAFSSASLTTMKKEHSICLLLSCQRFCLVHSCDFRSRSQIIHALHLTFSLNFLIRNKIIA